MDSDDRQAVEKTLNQLTGSFDGDQLTTSLDKFGWTDLLSTDPEEAVALLFAAQGRAGSWSSSFHDVLTGAGHLPDGAGTDTNVVLPRPRQLAPGTDGDSFDGLMVGARSGRKEAVVATGGDGSMRVFRLPVESISLAPVGGLDPGLSIQRASGHLSDAELLYRGEEAAGWWSTVVAAGRRALSFQLCGVMETMTDLAVAHAGERQQFGRPIGGFQAVRHRLAECRVACTGAYAAAGASFDGDDPELAALAAKVVTGRAQQRVAAHCQQVLAGIGFTAEHPFHRFMFRATVMDRLLGSAGELAPVLGREFGRRHGTVRLAEL
jgi:hypothetical protein